MKLPAAALQLWTLLLLFQPPRGNVTVAKTSPMSPIYISSSNEKDYLYPPPTPRLHTMCESPGSKSRTCGQSAGSQKTTDTRVVQLDHGLWLQQKPGQGGCVVEAGALWLFTRPFPQSIPCSGPAAAAQQLGPVG